MAAAIKILDEMMSELEILTKTANEISIKNSISEVVTEKTKTDVDNNKSNSSSSSEHIASKGKDTTAATKQGGRRPAPEKAPESSEPLNINALDLRVGIITAVSKHETAEKLYCEEIDVGEESPRSIASGLVAHYTLEEMKNRHVIVVCNLKPRNLVGFKSNGMVLCAVKTNDDGSEKVELLSPPVDAKAGERVTGVNLTGEPLSASQCDKKKAFESLAAGLKVVDGIATWDGIKLMVASGCGDITAPTVKEGAIR